MIGQIARDTGWSVNYILRGVNYPCLMMMWSDLSRYVEPRKKNLLELLQESEAQTEEKPVKGMSPFEFFKDENDE